MVAAGITRYFSSHSFHTGAATVAACNGIPNHLIQGNIEGLKMFIYCFQL